MLLCEDYCNKMKMVLNDPIYRKLTTNQTNRTGKQMATLARKLDILEEDANRLEPHASVPPRLYELLKIHKKDIPLRPNVNCNTSPTYPSAKYLTGPFSLVVRQPVHYIINSRRFIQKLHTINLQELDILGEL